MLLSNVRKNVEKNPSCDTPCMAGAQKTPGDRNYEVSTFFEKKVQKNCVSAERRKRERERERGTEKVLRLSSQWL